MSHCVKQFLRQVVGDGKLLLIWNSSLKSPLTHNIASEFDFCCVDWMSYNRFACGYDNGKIEMHQINEGSLKNNQQGITSIIFGKKATIKRTTMILKTFRHNVSIYQYINLIIRTHVNNIPLFSLSVKYDVSPGMRY